MNEDKRISCRYCKLGTMQEETFNDNVKVGRAKLHIGGLLRWRCGNCEASMIDARQFEHNEAQVRDAEDRKAGYVTVSMLREFREKYSLSQRDAGRLVGAGKSAFAKYEAGHHLSAPTAKLVRIALAVPEAALYLAREEGIEITIPELNRTDCVQIEELGTLMEQAIDAAWEEVFFQDAGHLKLIRRCGHSTDDRRNDSKVPTEPEIRWEASEVVVACA